MQLKQFFDNSGEVEENRDVFYASVSDLTSVSKDPELIGRYFILLVAGDFSRYTVDELGDFAGRMLDEGVVCVCTWGPDCKKMHDIFDENIYSRQRIAKRVFPLILTTWHTEDNLDKALWYALFVAFPVEEYKEECRSIMVVAVGNDEWNKKLISRLSDIESFNQEMLES
jgi:hypothetical protein